MTPELRQQLLERHGLTRPLYEQYWIYISNFFRGNLGQSFHHGQPVLPFILDRAANTLVVTLPAIIAAFMCGPIIGSILAWKRGERVDVVASSAFLATYAAPAFWVAMMAIMVFAFRLDILPAGGMRAASYQGANSTIIGRYLSWDFVEHAILPFSIYFIWQISRPVLLMRNNMLDVLDADFISMNRAQGLSEWSIMFRHAGRNSILPVIHYAALSLGFAVGGSVVIESVFSWPGLGRAMWQAVLQADYPVAQGAFFALSFFIIAMNFVADMISPFIDPRVTEEEE
jgi:peptide/nickel transport system permease protein